MSNLDPDNPADLEEIYGFLVREVMEELGAEEVYTLLTKSTRKIDTLASTTLLGSVEELNLMLTDFHFSQQVIFDFYPDEQDWQY